MIERRPHWDDDLINAVRTAMRPRILTCADTIDTYDVIAAVEDWLGPVEEMVNDGERVKRVRELPILGKAPQGNTALRGYNDGWNCCRMATLRVLDGDSDE